MKNKRIDNQNRAIWREMTFLENDGVSVTVGQVADGSRRNILESHLENFKEELLKAHPREKVEEAMGHFYAEINYLESNGFFRVKIVPVEKIDWKRLPKPVVNKTSVYVELPESKGHEFNGFKRVCFTLPKACSHYEVESAVWKKIKKLYPSYEHGKFLNSSYVNLYVSGDKKLYDWICCIY